VRVNDEKVDIPSYLVKPGDVIVLTPAALDMPLVQEESQTRPRVMPSWLERDGHVGRVIGYPRREDSDADIREDLIVEFYAR
jgi:small subunit ribosomal protein S4